MYAHIYHCKSNNIDFSAFVKANSIYLLFAYTITNSWSPFTRASYTRGFQTHARNIHPRDQLYARHTWEIRFKHVQDRSMQLLMCFDISKRVWQQIALLRFMHNKYLRRNRIIIAHSRYLNILFIYAIFLHNPLFDLL